MRVALHLIVACVVYSQEEELVRIVHMHGGNVRSDYYESHVREEFEIHGPP